jgi:uncharacterized protein (TIGR02246 family)
VVNPRHVADRYVAAMRAQNVDDLMALYAEDAVFVLPNGREFQGHAAIRAMHEGVLKAASPRPTPRAMVVGDAAVAVEIEVHVPDGNTRRTANFYHLNAQGRIQRLSVYMQTGRTSDV